MTIQRMDNVGIVVDDLRSAIAFFLDLGMDLEGEAQIEGLGPTAQSDSTASVARSPCCEPLGDIAEYGDSYRLCYIRGPEGIFIGLAEPLG